MIDEKKIEEAASLYANLNWKSTSSKGVCIDGFMAGVRWAQRRFPEVLWHDASEEPHVGRPLVGHDVDGFSIYHWRAQENTWEEFVGNCGLLKWCYISELMPPLAP